MTDLGQFSTFAIYSAIACYLIAMVAFGIDLSGVSAGLSRSKYRRAVSTGMALTVLGGLTHFVGVVTRGIASGRVPWANMYEFSIVFTLVVVASFLALQRVRDLRVLGLFVVGPVVLVLGLAVAVFYQRADGVQPSLDSYWLVIHVSTATIAIGLFGLAAVLSVVQLLMHRHEAKGQRAAVAEVAQAGSTTAVAAHTAGSAASGSIEADAAGSGGGTTVTAVAPSGEGAPDSPGTRTRSLHHIIAKLPGAVELERLAYRVNAVAFVLWTFTLIAGAIWAEHAWGRPWGWDPKETWSFVAWVVYAAYLHARATMGWAGRRAAWFGIAGFLLVLANFYLVNIFMPGLHSYAYS